MFVCVLNPFQSRLYPTDALTLLTGICACAVRPCVVFEWSVGTLVGALYQIGKGPGGLFGSLQRQISSGNKDLHCSYITFTQERFTFSSSMPHMGQFFFKVDLCVTKLDEIAPSFQLSFVYRMLTSLFTFSTLP